MAMYEATGTCIKEATLFRGQTLKYSDFSGHWTVDDVLVGRSAGVFMFNTPAFAGGTEYIRVSFGVIYSCVAGSMNVSLCSSDKNATKYVPRSTTVATQVTDDTQLVTGAIDLPEYNPNQYGYDSNGMPYEMYFSIELPVTTLKPNSTYYLIFWPDIWDGVDTNPIITSIEIGYSTGLIYVDNGSGLVTYQGYVDNGSSWDLVIPYIDNGSSWDMYT